MQPDPRAPAFKGFTDRVKDYISLQKKMETGLPSLKPSKSPAKIEAHRKALAIALRKARQMAKAGEVFGDTADTFKDLVRADTLDRSRRDRYAEMQEVPAKNPPAVNAEYPETASLATVPPLLLNQFPRLPEGIEYRFMGRALILRDAKANLIVDFVPDAVPAVRK